MTEPRVWEAFLTESDRAWVRATGPRPRFGFGERPAILSIDNYRAAVGDRPQDLLVNIQEWPSGMGRAAWEALDHVAVLLAAGRQASIPVVHVTALSEDESGIRGWGGRSGQQLPVDAKAVDRLRRQFDFVEQAAPMPGEVIIKKTAPSAFFGTPLVAHLRACDIDTLIVCGESVSGCVRASVVEARSYRFNVVVVEDCVYDRQEAARAINLFDMDQKYADVIGLDEVLTWIRQYGNREAIGRSSSHSARE